MDSALKSQVTINNGDILFSFAFLYEHTLLSEYFWGVSCLYVLLVITLFSPAVRGLNTQKTLSELVSLTLFLVSTSLLNDGPFFSPAGEFYLGLTSDSLALLAKLLVCIFASTYFLIVSDFLTSQKIVNSSYSLVLLLATYGLALLCSCCDLLTAFLTIELTSLSSYLVAAYRKDSSYSTEAGVTYFIIGSVSSATFLLGSSLVYGCCGSIFFSDIAELLANDFRTAYLLR